MFKQYYKKNPRQSLRGDGSLIDSLRGQHDAAEKQKIQGALNFYGFIAGLPDGVLDQQSRTAMSQIQASIDRPFTGKLDTFEEQFLKSSFFKAQASGNETLRLVVSKPNGYCEIPQRYHQELVQPTAKAILAQQNTTPTRQ